MSLRHYFGGLSLALMASVIAEPVLDRASGAAASSKLEREESGVAGFPAGLARAYFGKRPSRFLVDPQGLLGSRDAREREEFLSYHAGDSEIDLFIYLFDGPRVLPESLRGENLAAKFFGEGKPAVLVFYYLGAPEKSEMQVSPRLAELVSAEDRRRELNAAIEAAGGKIDAFGQFEAFCVQLSIGTYWMEREAGLVDDVDKGLVSRGTRVEAPVKKGDSAALASAKEWGARYGVPGGIVLGALVIVGGAIAVMRRRATFAFPVIDIPSRLGGDHAAGIGAEISFGSSTLSPSAQRSEVPDDLGL